MGLFSLIAKNIALMKEKAGKAGERLSINQIDSFTNLSYLKKKDSSKKRRGSVTDPSYFNLYLTKKKRIEKDSQMEPHAT